MKTTRLSDIISTGPVHKTTPDDSVQMACMVLSAANIGALPVVDLAGELVGLLSERDVIRRCVIVNRLPEETKVRQVMTSNPQWLPPSARASEALAVMVKGRFRHLPVCDGGKVVGMVSIRDFQPEPEPTSFHTRLRASLRPATA